MSAAGDPVALAPSTLHHDADVVVVGGGVAGLSTAVSAAALGLSVVLVDKGEQCGGTTRKASGGMMVPNNEHMRAAGVVDEKRDFMRFLARVGRPLLYDAEHPTLGLPEWEHDLIEVYYDNAVDAFASLERLGALQTVHQPGWASYNEVPEDKARSGRSLFVRNPDGSVGNGVEFMRQMLAGAERLGVTVLTGHRVAQALVDERNRVVGVVARSAAGPVAVGGRAAVVFATGGFTHNEALLREHLGGSYLPGCAAHTSEGDLVPIAKALGVPLHNMHACWGAPVVFEQALARDPTMISNFTTPGDSTFAVNKYGVRVGNEKTTYNDRTQAHFASWDPRRVEYPNFLLFPIWDERAARLHARVQKPGMESAGNYIPQPDGDWRYVLRGETLAELAAALDERLATLSARSGGVRLDPGFAERTAETLRRFNAFAAAGVDEDFRRGETAIELYMNGPRAADSTLPNATMFPLSETGPYFATILAPGVIETKGGPKVNARLQVLDGRERPVPGLYAVGNCAANPSGQAYWSGGGTFGPYVTFGYVAAHAIAESARVAAEAQPA